MTDAIELLHRARTVFLVDWPSRDVPDSLALAGFEVVSDDDPGRPRNAYRSVADGIRVEPRDAPPQQADIVYTHRPIDELPGIVEQARALGSQAIWYQSGLDESGGRDARGCWLPAEQSAGARQIVETAGLAYVQGPYIGDAARARAPDHAQPAERD